MFSAAFTGRSQRRLAAAAPVSVPLPLASAAAAVVPGTAKLTAHPPRLPAPRAFPLPLTEQRRPGLRPRLAFTTSHPPPPAAAPLPQPQPACARVRLGVGRGQARGRSAVCGGGAEREGGRGGARR
nr:unnamed protein product [Digitaria exilis]